MVYVYCHGYCGVQGYSDRGVLIGAVAVRVVYVYCHGYCGVQGYSDRGVLVQWQYAWCTCTATVTVEYRDTLTEGYWCSGSARGVRVLPRLLWSTGIL